MSDSMRLERRDDGKFELYLGAGYVHVLSVQQVRQLATWISEIDKNRFESYSIEDAYYDRNQAAMLAAKMARLNGYEAGWRISDDEPDWPVQYIELPTGQVSWHIPMAEALDHNTIMHNHTRPWDGHTLEEKRHRIVSFLLD